MITEKQSNAAGFELLGDKINSLLPTPKMELEAECIDVAAHQENDYAQLLRKTYDPKPTTRPELNIAIHSHRIFASPWAKDLKEPKEFSWPAKIGEREIDARISIRPIAGRKRPTTTTKLYYEALIQIWESQGKNPSGEFVFSDRQLTHVANRKWGGGVSSQAVSEHIDILASTSLTWFYSWKSESETTQIESGMNILLNPIKLSRKYIDPKLRFKQFHKVTLNPKIVKNLLAGTTKPFPFKSYSLIEDEGALPLFLFLDVIMADKSRYERKSKELFQDELGIASKIYATSRKHRRQQLVKWANSLNGVEISTGLIYCKVEETVDATDWKLVVTKASKQQTMIPLLDVVNDRENAKYIAEMVVEQLHLMNRGMVSKASMKTIISAARFYTREIMVDVAAKIKSDCRDTKIRNLGSFYMHQLKVECKSRGLEWYCAS